jgi:hypothetical protein
MPGATGVVQAAGVPARPSISTRQTRQEPKASRLSVAQSLGMVIPAIAAARRIEVPAGAVTARPSMVRVTGSPDASGVPRSYSRTRAIRSTPPPHGWERGKILREVPDRAHHGIGCEPAERAERAKFECLAELLDQGEVGGDVAGRRWIFATRLGPAHRADPARRALAAALDAAELEGEAGHRGHVDGVVEHHDAAVADQAVGGGEGLDVVGVSNRLGGK